MKWTTNNVKKIICSEIWFPTSLNHSWATNNNRQTFPKLNNNHNITHKAKWRKREINWLSKLLFRIFHKTKFRQIHSKISIGAWLLRIKETLPGQRTQSLLASMEFTTDKPRKLLKNWTQVKVSNWPSTSLPQSNLENTMQFSS